MIRWSLLFPNKPLSDSDIDVTIERRFERSCRVENLKSKDLNRLKKYGKDTLYFREIDFTFVVQNTTIVTIEVSSKDKRYLNKQAKIPDNINLVNCNSENQSLQQDKSVPANPCFKLTAYALCADGKIKAVNLGSYDSIRTNDWIGRLRKDEEFKREVIKRFVKKNPENSIVSVLASLGARGKKYEVFNEFDFIDYLLNSLQDEPLDDKD